MNARHWNGEPDAEHDPNAGGEGEPYVCVDCHWTDRGGVMAAEHHINTGHAVRGRRWPSSWKNAQFMGVERRKAKQSA